MQSQGNKYLVGLVIVSACTLTVFFLVGLIYWTIIPYSQIAIYSKYKLTGQLEDIFKSDFIFSPFNQAQIFIRKEILLHLTVIPPAKLNKQLFYKSIEEMEELLDYQSFQPYYYVLVAGAYVKKSHFSNDPSFLVRAEDAYKKALELSPKQLNLYYTYGQFLLGSRRPSDAYAVLKNAFDLGNKVPLSNFYLALAMMAAGEGNYEDILDHLEFFFSGDFKYQFEHQYSSVDPEWIQAKAIYRVLLRYFYEKNDVGRVLKIAERLSELDKAQGVSFQRIVNIIKTTEAMPVIEFENIGLPKY